MAVFCTGAPELKEYSWKKYNAVEETNTYTFWEKWSANISTRSGVVQGPGYASSSYQAYVYSNYQENISASTGYYAAKSYTLNSDNRFVLTDPLYLNASTNSIYANGNTGYIPAGYYFAGATTTDELSYTSSEQEFSVSVFDIGANPDTDSASYGHYAYRGTSEYVDPGADYVLTYEDDVTTYSKGSTSYGTVSSTNSSAYPSNGYKDGYWYVKTKTESTTGWAQGSTLQDTVTSFSPVAYPEDGYQDGYWYVRV